MKQLISLMLVLSMLLGCSVAMAEMGVQIIGGPETESEPVSLDDLKLNVEATIDGYGIIEATEFAFKDVLGYYRSGKNSVYNSDDFYRSGNEAEYAILKVDITNLARTSKDFLTHCEVRAVFDDVYEYAGWYYQYNYNNKTSKSNSSGEDSDKQNVRWVINAADPFSVGPMYQGHYAFGCTLPNAVVNSKQPLRLVITIDGNEITYNIRK